MNEMIDRTFVGTDGLKAYILQQDILCMADREAPSGLDAVSRGLGIASLAHLSGLTGLGNEERIAPPLLFDIFQRESTPKLDIEITDTDLTDRMSLNARNQTSITAVGIDNPDVGDTDITDLGGMETLRRAHTIAQANINR